MIFSDSEIDFTFWNITCLELNNILRWWAYGNSLCSSFGTHDADADWLIGYRVKTILITKSIIALSFLCTVNFKVLNWHKKVTEWFVFKWNYVQNNCFWSKTDSIKINNAFLFRFVCLFFLEIPWRNASLATIALVTLWNVQFVQLGASVQQKM